MKIKIYILLWILLVISIDLFGHPMPDSQMSLRIGETNIEGEIYLPESQLKLALPYNPPLSDSILIKYLLDHFKVFDQNGVEWSINILDLNTEESNDNVIANYTEFIATFRITPIKGVSPRKFSLFYDGIVHKVSNHSIFVSVDYDWKSGVIFKNDKTQIGIIKTDIPSNTVFPLDIDIKASANGKTFRVLFTHGINHIVHGIDHLLFLMLLIFGAFIVNKRKKWHVYNKPTKYIFYNLLKIVTAFTIGHSITLLLGSLNLNIIPPLIIELLVCISIFITAIHLVRPIHSSMQFHLLAGIFGLIHGFAFSETLVNINMSFSQKVQSVLAFNLGIEGFQVLIVIVISPVLSLLSKYQPLFYLFLVKVISVLALIFSVALIYSIIQDF